MIHGSAGIDLTILVKPTPNPNGYPFSGMIGTPHEGDWGVIPGLAEEDYDDANTVDYAGRAWAQTGSTFLPGVRHLSSALPWYAPQRFFDLYPLADIRLPKSRANDLEDIPSEGRALSARRRNEFLHIKKHGKWKEASARTWPASVLPMPNWAEYWMRWSKATSPEHDHCLLVRSRLAFGRKITGTKARSGRRHTHSVSHLRTGRDAW